jgi:hypothetical protein
MADVLKRVTFVSPVEIRRFLNDTFDALFGILEAHAVCVSPFCCSSFSF